MIAAPFWVNGAKGYHDLSRYPEGRTVPGLVLFRWDAQLFFANGEIFRDRVKAAVASASTPTRRVVVAAEAITNVDVTAADALVGLHEELQQKGIELHFAGLKDIVRERLEGYGILEVLGDNIFAPTVGNAVNQYRETYVVDWKDWDEV